MVIVDPARLPQASERPSVFPWEELRAELVKLSSTEHSSTGEALQDETQQVGCRRRRIGAYAWSGRCEEVARAVDEVTIGARLRTLRRWRGKSQTELAGLAGLSPSFLSMVETGKRPLGPALAYCGTGQRA